MRFGKAGSGKSSGSREAEIPAAPDPDPRNGRDEWGMARPVDPNLRFDEKTRRAYEAWLDGDSRHLLRMAIGFGMVAYSINHIGDYSFPGADIDALFLARMSVVCVLLAMLALMVLRRNVSVSAIAILISVSASVSNTIIGLDGSNRTPRFAGDPGHPRT